MTQANSSQESPRLDPFEFWRQMYEANEQGWSKVMKEVTTTSTYAEAQGKLLETFLAYQKMLRDNMTTQLGNLNIPTRDDVSRLGELVVSLEEKVDQLDDRLAELAEVISPVGKRLGAVEGKVGDGLASLDVRIASLEKKIESFDRRLTRQGDKIEEVVGEAVQEAAQLREEAVPARPARRSQPARSRGKAETNGSVGSKKDK